MIRTIDVTSSGKSRVQNYRLTEVGKKPRALVEDNWYEFKVFLNGMRRSGRHENDLLIADAYYMNDQSL